MFDVEDKLVLGMAGLRLLSGSIEIIAALLMLYYGTIERAVTVNAFLSLVGPIVLILVTTIGLIGLADKLDFTKMVLVMCGVALILYGVRS
ncbi:YqhV family protein [Effusibacillus consociatus]|uniref:YqhV family protein n=1 Tax=Effusibacillus consociatus TaxID=1117041 RepID=A0ABV9Q5J3_9BACL